LRRRLQRWQAGQLARSGSDSGQQREALGDRVVIGEEWLDERPVVSERPGIASTHGTDSAGEHATSAVMQASCSSSKSSSS